MRIEDPYFQRIIVTDINGTEWEEDIAPPLVSDLEVLHTLIKVTDTYQLNHSTTTLGFNKYALLDLVIRVTQDSNVSWEWCAAFIEDAWQAANPIKDSITSSMAMRWPAMDKEASYD